MSANESHSATTSGGPGQGKTPDGPVPPRKPHTSAGLVQIFPRPIDAAPRTYKVRGQSVIGRTDEASVTIADRRVSRRHALIEQVQGGFAVTDLDSRHGT